MSSGSNSLSRPSYSCIRCAERKVKCDRQRPFCAACTKHKVECVYKPPQQPRKRQKRAQVQALTDRLKYYEALLHNQGIDPSRPDVEIQPVQVTTPSSTESELSPCMNKTQLLHGQGRFKFVDNGLWTRVLEEFHDPEDVLDDFSDDGNDHKSSENDFDFILGSPANSNTKPHHPPVEHVHQLVRIFIENVDPLTKIIHPPTLKIAVERAIGNSVSIPRSFEALMFSIYGAAVMSMKEEECRHRFCETRTTLLSRYISATRTALSRANFMATMSLVVLQALVLHIISVRDIYEPRAIWTMTGIAVRIAQGMGLERDGAALGLPPFETEIRRRIWWTLKNHDFRTAELCGLTKFRDLDMGPESTKGPTNINDDQLYRGMASLPIGESNKLTDVVFVTLKHEFASCAAGRIAKFRHQGKGSSQWDLHTETDRVEMEEFSKKIEENLETKYIRHCDPSKPLHLLTMLIARFSINTIQFIIYHPRRWTSLEQTPLSVRQKIWKISIDLLEQYNMMLSNPQLTRFAWHAAYYQQWHATIHVLDTLRANPQLPEAEKAWQLICTICEHNPLDTNKPIHIAVGNLCLKAYAVWETVHQHFQTPGFISQLRQQREASRAKKQAKLSLPDTPEYHRRSRSRNQGLNTNVVPSTNSMEDSSIQKDPNGCMSSVPRPGGSTGNNPDWLINNFRHGQFENLEDILNMDQNNLLARDFNTDTGTIAWDQWDAWLADSNVNFLLP